MSVRRTDLAVEARLLRMESAEEGEALEGVSSREEERDGFAVTAVEVTDERGAAALGKPVGRYLSVELDPLLRGEEDSFARAVHVVAELLKELLPVEKGEGVLVVGLGNRAVTPDLIGPLAAEHVLVTRHLVQGAPEHFGSFRPVSAVTPGVLATTGLESAEIAAAVAGAAKPAAVIVIDALASRAVERLCRTVQLADTGITPGSGVGNHRSAIDRTALGVPVLSVGVPTVVDGATLALDLLEQAGVTGVEPAALNGEGSDLFVTPREIDVRVSLLGKVIGYAVSLAVQPGLTLADLTALLE